MPIMDENDVSLPKATLSKMIREFMPSEVRLAGDAMDMIIECCTEFVSLVSSESNDVSNREKRNTIHPDHVLKALHELGLQEFIREVTSTWETWKEESKCRPTGAHKPGNRKTAADVAGLSEEEQIALQQQLFAAARRSFQLPELRNEAGPTTGAPNAGPSPLGGEVSGVKQEPLSNMAQQAGSFAGFAPNQSYLAQHLGLPLDSASGMSQLSQYQPQALHQGVSNSHTVGYAVSESSLMRGLSEKISTPPEPCETKPSMPVSSANPSRSGSTVSSSGYGSDVLPIPPLQAQPIPSAFHPASTTPLSAPLLASEPHLQSSVLSQGLTPSGTGNTQQCMFLLQPGALVSQAGSVGTSNVQTLWTSGHPQMIPEVHLSQPVVVLHNGVQHLIPLQALLSRVGGLQQFRMNPAGQSGLETSAMLKSGALIGGDGNLNKPPESMLQIKEEQQQQPQLLTGLVQANAGLVAGTSSQGVQFSSNPLGGGQIIQAASLSEQQAISAREQSGAVEFQPMMAATTFASANPISSTSQTRAGLDRLLQQMPTTTDSEYGSKMEQHFSAVHPSSSGPSAVLGERITSLSIPSAVQPLATAVPQGLSASLQLGCVDGQAQELGFELQTAGVQIQNPSSSGVNAMGVPSANPAFDAEEVKRPSVYGQVQLPASANPSKITMPDAVPSALSAMQEETPSDPPQSTQKRERDDQLADGDTIQDGHSPVRKKKNQLVSDVLCEPTRL